MGASAAEPVASSPLSPRLQRQRSFASVISTRCCSSLCIGRSSHASYDVDDLFRSPGKAAMGCLHRRPQKQASHWQDSNSLLLGSRRLKGSRRGLVFCSGGATCPEVEGADDEVYYKPSPWKLFLRKLRAETKKMNCTRPSTGGFHYDAISYAMNFDDGGWQPPQQYYCYPSESSSYKLDCHHS